MESQWYIGGFHVPFTAYKKKPTPKPTPKPTTPPTPAPKAATSAPTEPPGAPEAIKDFTSVKRDWVHVTDDDGTIAEDALMGQVRSRMIADDALMIMINSGPQVHSVANPHYTTPQQDFLS